MATEAAPLTGTLPRGWWLTLAIAASAVVAVLAAALLIGPPTTAGRQGPASAPRLGVAAQAAVTSLFGTESDFLRTRAELLEALESNRQRLAPETLATFLDNLEIIDQSIVEIAAAHADNPGNPRLSRLLAAACQRELELLQRASEVAGRDGTGSD